MSLTSKLINKSFLLFSVGYIGGLKLFLFYLVNETYSDAVLASLVYQWAVVTLATMIILGFNTLLSARLPKSTNAKERAASIYPPLVYGLSSIPPVLTIWFIFGEYYNFGSFVFLFSIYVYGLYRSICFAVFKYFRLFLVEFSSFLGISAWLLFSKGSINEGNISWIFSVLGAFSVLGILSFVKRFPDFKCLGVKDFVKGLSFGFSNFLSGGISMLTVVYLGSIVDESTLAKVGIILSVVSVVLLIPRSMAQVYIPRLAGSSDGEFYSVYSGYVNINNKIQILLFASMPFIWGIASYVYNINFSDEFIFAIFFLSFLSSIVSQRALPVSNFFMVKEIPDYLFKSNLAYSISIVSLIAVFSLSGNLLKLSRESIIIFIFSATVVLGFVRYKYLLSIKNRYSQIEGVSNA